MPRERAGQAPKGFAFEADDTEHAVVCRDVRGFAAALEAARDRKKPGPGRLLIVIPDLAMVVAPLGK